MSIRWIGIRRVLLGAGSLLALGMVAPRSQADDASTASNGRLPFRPINEQGNNVQHPSFGIAGTALLRGPSGSHYGDGISSMAGAGRPSARTASTALFAQSQSLPSRTGLSDFIWTWGQFLDHDLSLTEGTTESEPIAIPKGDPFFDPSGSGAQVMPFHRGFFDPTTGATSPRAQINEITAFIDGSNVYGSSDDRLAWLRTHTGGRMKATATPVGEMLPFNDGTQPNAGSPEKPNLSPAFFVAGDIRVNEQPTLACMHTLFVREHNRLADHIARSSPGLSDEEIFQRARRVVIGELEHVTYEEFLPALLGDRAIPSYRGYDPSVDVGVSAVFSTAAYRLGHTLLSPQILRLGPDGRPIAAGPLSLRDSFFDATPPMLTSQGIEPFLRGIAAQRSQELDAKIIDDVRNFLFGPPGAGGLDLVSLNIQRGRDLGLPDYNTIRVEYGFARKTQFKQISSDPAVAAALASIYKSPDDIDAFVGLFVEDDAPRQIVGETLRAVLVDQFSRSRNGDRFWYERSLEGEDLALVKRSSLSEIIRRNTVQTDLQRNVFFVRGEGGNSGK